ncbi:hypothetical protein, partial [Alistipes sp. ZOR0009]|uniref:hypothetical protein n=1 Tax=Alistipes sp. ZOR0009 TaxID=1339253 RepID=UPI00064793D0
SRRCELIFALFFVLLFCAKKVAGRNQQNAVVTISGCALLFCYFWMVVGRPLLSKDEDATEHKLRPEAAPNQA